MGALLLPSALAGLALTHLCLAARKSGDPVWPGKALQRFKDAGNMTDRFNALAALVTGGHELGNAALERFHAMFKDEALVLDKWFALQAGAPDRGGNILPGVKQLMKHPDFNLKNPNRATDLQVAGPLESVLRWVPDEWLIASGLASEPVIGDQTRAELERESVIETFDKRLKVAQEGRSYVMGISFTSTHHNTFCRRFKADILI